MNWEMFDRLVQHLKTMNPEEFNYWRPSTSQRGPVCVACHCRAIQGLNTAVCSQPDDIERFLGVTVEESMFLYDAVDETDPYPLEFAGERGIANALHRLDIVASHYTRPAVSVASQTIEPTEREKAWLLSLMAQAAEPVET